MHEQSVQKIEDSNTELHKVNRWTYFTGAESLYFVDDVVAPQVLGVFGPGPQDTGILERELPRLTEQLAGSFAQIASQTDVPNPPHSRWQKRAAPRYDLDRLARVRTREPYRAPPNTLVSRGPGYG